MVALILLSPALSPAQGEAAVPFLQITPSPCTNGMGGAAAVLPSFDAFAPMVNPGQLGLLSLQNVFNASTYTPKTNWLPSFHIDNLTYSATSLNAGLDLAAFLPLPFPLGVGVGYSRISIELGTFYITGPGGTDMIGSYQPHEESENISVGVGLDYYVRLGIGMNSKRVSSFLAPIGTEQEKDAGTAKVTATDFGLLLVVPVPEIVSKAVGKPIELVKGVDPLLDLSTCYVRSNQGGEVRYLVAALADPLPRTAKLGLALEAGATAKAGSSVWKLASASLVRQAEDILVTRHGDGTFEYQSGVGEINFVQNVIEGRYPNHVLVRKGWELQVGECLFLRGGSVHGMGFNYETSGYSIALGGLVRMLEFASPDLAQTSWIAFLGDHLDLQYHSSSYDGTSSPLYGTAFHSLNLVVKGLP